MASTTFTDGQTPILASWLNDVNDAVYNGDFPVDILASNVSYVPSGTGAVDRTVQQKLSDYVSVLDFGADNTGATDSSTAIQNAVNAGSNTVYFPPGTYLMNHPVQVPYNVSIKGAGKGVTKIQAGSGISGNFSNFNFASTPTCETSLFNFLPGQVPLKISALSGDISRGDVSIEFATSHGLSKNDILVLCDTSHLLLVQSISGSGFQVGETITGGTSGATGVIKRINVIGTNAYIWYSVTNGSFIPYYGGSSSTETVTGNTSGTTATSIRQGGSFSAHRPSYALGEFVQVADVTNSTTIQIDGTIVDNFYANTTEVWKLRQPSKSTLSDISIFGSGDDTTYPFGVMFIGGSGNQMHNVEMGNFFYAHAEFYLCYQPKVYACEINQNETYGGSSDYYGVVIANTYGAQVRNSSICAVRHPVAIGGYSYGTNLPNPNVKFATIENNYLATSAIVQAGDIHGNGSYCTYRNNTILGGIAFGGSINTIENNIIYGIGESQSSIAIYLSELQSTEHIIRNNTIIGKATPSTAYYGLLYLHTGTYYGICMNGGPMQITGNRIVLEGGSEPVAPTITLGDTCGVGFTNGFNFVFEHNNLYNSTNYIHIYPRASTTPIISAQINNNIFRGNCVANFIGRQDVKNTIFKNNYIDNGSTTLTTASAYVCGSLSVVCTDNIIKNAPAGGFVIQASNTQQYPSIVQNNTVVNYGYVINGSNSLDNGGFNFYRDTGGTSETRAYFTNNRILSAQSTAQSAVRNANVTLIYRENSYDFAAPSGGNWVAYDYTSGAAVTSYESPTFYQINLNNGPLGIPDGITAPSTASGTAYIYVDSADGDLKIKFGDGTVKTIVTDT